MKEHAAIEGHEVSKAAFGNLLNGRGNPRWHTVEAFVAGCMHYARTRTRPRQLAPELADLAGWRARYEAAYPDAAARPAGSTSETAFADARREYEERLRERYGRIDLEALTPLTEQNEHPPVDCGRVFVAQSVRADPPPVELPKEVVRRLIESGELGKGGLPDGVDPELLANLRQTYQERPAQPVPRVLAEAGRQRLVLLGDPGAGKSTLARYLTLSLTKETATGPLTALTGWLPVLVELRTYADARWRDCTFLDLIDHLHVTEGLGLPDAQGDGWLFPMMDDDMLDAYVGDHGLSPSDRVWLHGRAVGQPIAVYREPAPADLSTAESLPRTYIVCTGDPQVPLPAGIEVVKFEAGHWPMVTKPAELAAELSRIAMG